MRMKRIFDIDIYDEFKRAQIIQFVIMLLTFALSFIVRKYDRSVFSFSYFVELCFLIPLFRFYFLAQKNRNYSFWGITFVLAFYLLRAILQYTFIEYYPIVLYFAFLALIFLAVNCYFMSSPLFYPRVQWWEYDFRYRGDFKIFVRRGEKKFEARLTDVRRNAGCLEAFEFFNPGVGIHVILNYDGQAFDLPAVVKIVSQNIPGRPYRYGIVFVYDDLEDKKSFQELRTLWSQQNRVKLRNKFANIKHD